MESLLQHFEQGLATATRNLVTRAREQLDEMKRGMERQCAHGLAEVEAQRTALQEEIAAMQQVEHAQDSRVALNVGGVRYETSIATLRRTPGTMLDAMFSGRHAMDPDDGDGAHFLDRDGAHFKYVLAYLRDGASVLEEAAGDVRLLRALKREFGYFAIDLDTEQQHEAAVYVMGGWDSNSNQLSSMERYDPATDTWAEVQPMPEARFAHAVGMVADYGMYVAGGLGDDSVVRYDPGTDTWDSAVVPMPAVRWARTFTSWGALLRPI